MTLTLYTNTSEVNAVNKTITELADLTGTLREQSSIIDPVIIVTDCDSYIASANYAYIPEFGRYYFINDVTSIRNNFLQLTMHVDVLYSFKDAILTNSAIIERNAHEYDLKLNDGLFQTQQNPRIEQYAFPSGFTDWNFVLAVAGN